MPRRKPLPPDTRPDWRDPNLKPLRERASTKQLEPFNLATVNAHSQMMLEQSIELHFSRDPSYNWRRKRR